MAIPKHFIILTLGFLINNFRIGAQCPPGDIHFSTQQQLEEYASWYPDCSTIQGNVVIGVPYGTSDVYDLSGLKQIQKINGYLNILNNPRLISLSGLNSLKVVGDYVNIFHNESLQEIHDLKNLQETGGSFWILYNQRLSSIHGLQSLTNIGGSLDISHNPSLNELDGLHPVSTSPALDFTLTQINAIRIMNNGRNLQQETVPQFAHFYKTDPVLTFRNLSGLPYSTRAVETSYLYTYIDQLQDPNQMLPLLNKMEKISIDINDSDLNWEFRLLRQYFKLKHGSDPVEKKIRDMRDFAKSAGLHEKLIIQARATKFLAFTLWDHFPDYEQLFKTYHHLEEIMNQLSPNEFPDMAQCYMIIGRAHYYFRDYREAIHYFRKAETLPAIPFNTTFILHSRNNVGLCYQQLKLLDSSDLSFRQIIEDPGEFPIEIWKGIASGNLGYNYYLRKQYDQAIPFLERDYLTAESIEDWGLAAGSLTPLADIYIRKNELNKAETMITKAREYINRSGQKDRLRLLYPVMAKWYASLGSKDLATDFVDSTEMAIQIYNDKFNALKLLRAKQELNANELALREIQKQKLIQQRNSVLGLLTLSFLLGMVFFYQRNQNHKRQEEIRELKLKNTRESLDHARTKLLSLTQKIRENNEIIERMQLNYSSQPDFKMIRELQNATILTMDDWDHFKQNFQMTYPGFIEIMESRYPDLTSSEIRCLCLQKLRMSTKDIAAALGVSPKSINVTNHRIRKKLHLDNQDILIDLIENTG